MEAEDKQDESTLINTNDKEQEELDRDLEEVG